MVRIWLILPVLWMSLALQGQGVLFSMEKEAVRSRIVHDVLVLASDSLQGREAGTEGERKAARYLSSQFREAGLLPKGKDSGSYYQEFVKFQVGYHWTTKLTVDDIRYTYRKEFGVTSLSMNGDRQGILVDGQQGLVIPERNIDQFSDAGDIRGRIILIDLQVADTLLDNSTMPGRFTPKNRMKSALDRGAIGVIFWNPDSPWLENLFNFRDSDTLPGIALYADMNTAVRLKRQTGTLARVNVQIDRKTNIYTNIIGYIDNQASQTIVIGAHFDHLGMKNDGGIFYGADDNASGTAGILELARYYSTHRDTVNNYLFIAFSAEEKGLWGSDYFINNPTIPLASVRYMLNLDMIGRLGSQGNILEVEATGSSAEWRGILKSTPHPCFRINRINASLPYSDHDPFYQAKIPVLFFTTGLHDDYHTLTDHAATLNYDGIVNILRFIRDMVSNAGQGKALQHRKVPAVAQAGASIDFFFQAVGWMMTVKN